MTLGLPRFPVAEILPRRDETQFFERYERRVSQNLSDEEEEAKAIQRRSAGQEQLLMSWAKGLGQPCTFMGTNSRKNVFRRERQRRTLRVIR